MKNAPSHWKSACVFLIFVVVTCLFCFALPLQIVTILSKFKMTNGSFCDSESHTEVACCEAISPPQKKKVGNVVTQQNKHPFGQGNEIIKAPSIHPSIIFYQHFS